MKAPTMYIPISTPALTAAACRLRDRGVFCTDTAQDAEYLLYPAPTKLSMLSDCTMDQTVIGGNLDFLNESVCRLGLLKDPYYLAANAAITAMLTSSLACGFRPSKARKKGSMVSIMIRVLVR